MLFFPLSLARGEWREEERRGEWREEERRGEEEREDRCQLN